MKNFVTRPQSDGLKIHSKNEFELCYLRHQYLRKVDYNPTEVDMAPYVKIIRYMSRNTFYKEGYLFNTIGMDSDDIVNICKVYLVEFLGLFVLSQDINPIKLDEFIVNHQRLNGGDAPSEDEILSKNKAHFTMFMKQRLEDLIRICRQKAKNIKGTQVDEYISFYGEKEPPKDLRRLIENNQAEGFKKMDKGAFKTIKKRTKAKVGEAFQFGGLWYVAVPLAQRNLTLLDFAGAGLDPYESLHNKNPEQLLTQRQNDLSFDKQRKKFKMKSKEDRVNIFKTFIHTNAQNPFFKEEIDIAKRMLRNLGSEYGK